MCGDQRATHRIPFAASTMGVLGIKLRSQAYVTSAFTHRAIASALELDSLLSAFARKQQELTER